MAGHELIDAELSLLAARLPAEVAEELADGLSEAYEHQLAWRGDPEAAARAAIAEFGDADTVTAAFIRASPWRRAATLLLATGPVMAALWATTLLSTQAWRWPIPAQIKIGYGVLLTLCALLLLAVVRTRRHYRRTRPAVLAASGGLIVLDSLALLAVVLVEVPPTWAMTLAALASLTRIMGTIHALPTLTPNR
ncbi:permease prefix domain 1-containing protein [Acrocarpospora sp. B8E8]|uniref:permease prefix domain 1-containing protein n=1 Tax=Acrocarpospora sp. B8E8 TaxID=3153572 RepID=UPI00325F9033